MITENELKKMLQKLRSSADFNIIYTDKKSKKVHGLYYPDKKEILIHNRNFFNDSELILVALHEYAHHIQNTEFFMKLNPHDIEFWKIYYELVFKAEKLGFYKNIAKEKHAEDYKKFIEASKKFNAATLEFYNSVCLFSNIMTEQNHEQFNDVCERVLKMPRGESKKILRAGNRIIDKKDLYHGTIMSISGMKDIDSEMFDELKFEKSVTLDMFKFYHSEKKHDSEIEYLEDVKEKKENQIQRNKEKIIEVANKIKRIFSKNKTEV